MAALLRSRTFIGFPGEIYLVLINSYGGVLGSEGFNERRLRFSIFIQQNQDE